MKIDGKTNTDIQKAIEERHGIKYSTEHLSSLWRNKIPKVIAEQEKMDYLIWYYTYERPDLAKWKKCSCCGQRKPALNRFFSKNKTAKDGFYSICKVCRNKKTKKEN
jgi:hypothetical protein